MKPRGEKVRRLPGYIATGLMIASTALWTFWGVAEMYHEGWWGAWYNRLPYLIPGTACLLLTLAALAWPFVGGGLIVVTGIWFVWFFDFPKLVGLVVALVGALLVVEGFDRRRRRQAGMGPHPRWWLRNLGYLLAVVPPVIIAIGISAYMLPIVLTRVDDGDRGARRIAGNGVTLIWAPAGPGWNWRQPWGGYPSWHSLALYGHPPVGLGDKPGYGRETGAYASGDDMAATNLCRYLSADGLTLADAPQDIWRMPTTDDVVRSLGRHGENAGCAWQGEYKEQTECAIQPDKESPLWATDQPVIYYWTADEYDDRRGYFVAYNGMVNAAYKAGGNPRHGYRCVREP